MKATLITLVLIFTTLNAYVAGYYLHPIPPPFPNAYENCRHFSNVYPQNYCLENKDALLNIIY